MKRFTELHDDDIKILVRRKGEKYEDGHVTEYVYSVNVEEDYKEAAHKLFTLENFEEKMSCNVNTLLKALFNGFYFKSIKNKDLNHFITFNAINRDGWNGIIKDEKICFSKDTTLLEDKNPIFNKIGYDSKPLPLFKVTLSIDDMALIVNIWTFEKGYTFYRYLYLNSYGTEWSLNKHEIL